MMSRFLAPVVAALLCGCAAGRSPGGSAPADADSPPWAAFNPSTIPDTIVGGSRVYLETEIDRPAMAIPSRAAAPPYPSGLRGLGIEGHVEVIMVIDTAGSVEMSTVHLISSNHPAFTASVRDVLPKTRFTPAERGGRPVRAWRRLSFGFRVGML